VARICAKGCGPLSRIILPQLLCQPRECPNSCLGPGRPGRSSQSSGVLRRTVIPATSCRGVIYNEPAGASSLWRQRYFPYALSDLSRVLSQMISTTIQKRGSSPSWPCHGGSSHTVIAATPDAGSPDFIFHRHRAGFCGSLCRRPPSLFYRDPPALQALQRRVM